MQAQRSRYMYMYHKRKGINIKSVLTKKGATEEVKGLLFGVSI
jgi:hypothetical protein